MEVAIPTRVKKLQWETSPFFIASADERKRDVIAEECFQLSQEVQQRQIDEAREFLTGYGIKM